MSAGTTIILLAVLGTAALWLPPWESVVSLMDLDALDAPTATGAIVRILVYAAVWIGVGVLGLRRLMTNGALSRTDSP